MNFWFTADTHYGHKNIIEYCKRPYKTLEEMNAKLVQKHNERVKEGDVVFHLGDFCFRNSSGGKEGEGALNRAQHYLKQLNGNIIVIKGNHDKNNLMKTIINHCVIEIGGEKIFLVHNPDDYDGGYKINLVGHIHEAWKIRKIGHTILVNVGVDVWKYMPINIQEIMKAVEDFKREK